jgi:CRISPR-associated protein Cas2
MEMTVVVTRNAPDRVRGFLASCMCEIAPGVYTGPGMSQGVRQRVWAVMDEWWPHFPECAIVMTWPDKKAVGGQQFWVLGAPKVVLHEQDGMFLVRGTMTTESWRSLKTEDPK